MQAVTSRILGVMYDQHPSYNLNKGKHSFDAVGVLNLPAMCRRVFGKKEGVYLEDRDFAHRVLQRGKIFNGKFSDEYVYFSLFVKPIMRMIKSTCSLPLYGDGSSLFGVNHRYGIFPHSL